MIGEQYALMIGCLLAAAAAFRPLPEPPAAVDGGAEPAGSEQIVAPRLVVWGSDGRIERELSAERLDRPAAADDARLTRPRLRAGTGSGSTWQVAAARATVAPGEARIAFDGDVVADIVTGGAAGVTLHTEHLTIEPGHKWAWTDGPARLRARTGAIEAGGFEADLATGRLRLVNRVRGAHEAQTH